MSAESRFSKEMHACFVSICFVLLALEMIDDAQRQRHLYWGYGYLAVDIEHAGSIGNSS
jgi:hypothetical protein